MENNKLHILNPEHCIEILSTILDNNYPMNKVKYSSYISMSYFVEYIESFNSEQIESILSHKNFNLYASNRFVVDLVELSKKSYLSDNTKNILSNYEYQFKKIINKDKIHFLLNYDFNKENTKDIITTILDDVCFYLKTLKEINPEYMNKLLSSPGIESIAKHPMTEKNLLQTIVENTQKNQINTVVSLCMNDYPDILLKDLNQYVGYIQFNYKLNYCLYLFENKHYKVFNALAPYNKQLNDFDQKVVLNGVVEFIVGEYIQEKAKYSNVQTNFAIDKYIDPLLHFDGNKVLQKINQLIQLNQIDSSILISLQNNVLNHNLNNKLVEKNTNEKRLKI